MAIAIPMPKLGMTMMEGTVTKWLKKEGDPVAKGDVLYELESDKLSNVAEAYDDGVLLKIVVPEGVTVPILTTVGYIGKAGEKLESDDAATSLAAPEEAPSALEPAPGGGKKKVLIVGGGPGGYVAAIRAAQLGAEVTVVEKERLGGTCLNIGCIPTKCLLHSAEMISDLREQGAKIGVVAKDVEVDFPRVIAHKNEVSSQLTSGVSGLLRANKVQVISGTAVFTGRKMVRIDRNNGNS